MAGSPGKRKSGAGRLRHRRLPVQQRGRERVDAILNATSAIVREHGLARLSTNLIARKAGMPIGTIYQFFPNKSAILIALQRRFNDAINAVLDGLLAASRSDLGLVDDLIDALWKLWKEEDTLVLNWHALRLQETGFAASEEEATGAVLRRNEELLGKLGVPAGRQRRMMSAMLAESINAHLDCAVNRTPPARRRTVQELKRMLRAWVASAIPPSRK